MICSSCGSELPPATKLSQRTVVCSCGHENDLSLVAEATTVASAPKPEAPPIGQAVGGTPARAVSSVAPSNAKAHFPDLLIGKVIGKGCYRIDQFLGEGGMGRVYKGEQFSLGRSVAIKVLHDRLAEDAEFVKRFAREAKTLAKLEHPNIVRVYDAGEEEGLYHIVMAFLSGAHGKPQTLQAMIESDGELEIDVAYKMMAQACSALEYAHSKGIIHRDIKPGNFLIDQHQQLMLADFGIAALRHAGSDVTRTMTGSSMGSSGYMSPEQRKSAAAADHRSDIYSLGVVLYEVLVGERPDFSTMASDAEQFRWPSKVRREVPAAIDDVIRKALKTDPASRYQSAKEMWEAIDHARKQPVAQAPAQNGNQTPKLHPVGQPASRKVPPRRSLRRRLTAPALAGLVLAIVVMVLWPQMISGGSAKNGGGSNPGVQPTPTTVPPTTLQKNEEPTPPPVEPVPVSTEPPPPVDDPAGSPSVISTPQELAERGSLVELKTLLESGNNLTNEKDANGDTVLLIACRRCDKEMITYLVEERNAGVNIANYAELTPLRAVLENECELDRARQVEMARLLVKHGAKADWTDADGNTPVMHATIELQDPEVTTELLEILVGAQIANVAAPNIDGITPLCWVFTNLKSGHPHRAEAMNLLMGKGAKLDCVNPESGDTMLHIAASSCEKTEAEEIIRNGHGQGVNAKNKNNETPLHTAAQVGCLALVELLARSADKNAASLSGDTPMHLAAAEGHMDVVQALVKAGASRREKNKALHTPAETARAAGHNGIADYLDGLSVPRLQVPPPPAVINFRFDGEWRATFKTPAERDGSFTLRIDDGGEKDKPTCTLIGADGVEHPGKCIIQRSVNKLKISFETKTVIDPDKKARELYEGNFTITSDHEIVWMLDSKEGLGGFEGFKVTLTK